ncbi:MAG: alpha/beta fold hydrolase [Acidimicrobiales bacterium]|nr:alpha/beta fold hydrolase [Acidimicrobiales bacterium]
MSGPPVVLLHGLATSAARTWGENGWIDLLQEAGRTVLAIDLLGHGTADKPHDPEAYERLEALVAEQLPDEPVDIIGFSLGARTTLALAIEDPSRFRKIVVAGVGANLFEQDEERAKAIARGVAGDPDPEDRTSGYFAQLAESPEIDRHALAALMRRKRALPVTKEGLAKVTNPVLVVLGDQDFAGPADPLVEALPNATFLGVRKADHFSIVKDFKFIDGALKFLDAFPG